MKIVFAESHNLDRPDPLGSHQYIRLFREEGHDCLWLGPALSPLHLLKLDATNRHRFRVWREGLRRVDGIDWLVPFSLLFYYNLPILRSNYIGRHQYRFCLPPLKNKVKAAGFYPADLLWCAGPVALSLLDLIPHKQSCYRLADRLDKFSRIPPGVGELQKEMIKRVDFVLATSRSLLEWAREARRDNVYYLPNGVDERFFEPVPEKPADFPDDGKPVAVYLGTLDTRFDLEALGHGVLAEKDLHFLVIGPVTDERLVPGLRTLQEEKNFTWLGPRDHHLVPAYLQYADAGLIPFQLNELTEAVNPIKYYEYLACGLPVVAPPLRELAVMKGPLYAYRGKEGFLSALKKALAAGESEREENRAYARKQTWRSRYEEIKAIMTGIKTPAGTGPGGRL